MWIDFYKFVRIFSWLVPGAELKNPRLMDAIQVDFTGLKNVTFSKLINYAIVLCWYDELEKCVDCCSESLHNTPLQARPPFHTTW